MAEGRSMLLYHVTTPRKVKRYRESGRIIAPVRGFTTLEAAMAWGMKTGRTVILKLEGHDCHKLPDHHNEFGDAWWVDHDVKEWVCRFSAGKAEVSHE